MTIHISRSQRLMAVIGISCSFFLAEIAGMHLRRLAFSHWRMVLFWTVAAPILLEIGYPVINLRDNMRQACWLTVDLFA